MANRLWVHSVIITGSLKPSRTTRAAKRLFIRVKMIRRRRLPCRSPSSVRTHRPAGIGRMVTATTADWAQSFRFVNLARTALTAALVEACHPRLHHRLSSRHRRHHPAPSVRTRQTAGICRMVTAMTADQAQSFRFVNSARTVLTVALAEVCRPRLPHHLRVTCQSLPGSTIRTSMDPMAKSRSTRLHLAPRRLVNSSCTIEAPQVQTPGAQPLELSSTSSHGEHRLLCLPKSPSTWVQMVCSRATSRTLQTTRV